MRRALRAACYVVQKWHDAPSSFYRRHKRGFGTAARRKRGSACFHSCFGRLGACYFQGVWAVFHTWKTYIKIIRPYLEGCQHCCACLINVHTWKRSRRTHIERLCIGLPSSEMRVARYGHFNLIFQNQSLLFVVKESFALICIVFISCTLNHLQYFTLTFANLKFVHHEIWDDHKFQPLLYMTSLLHSVCSRRCLLFFQFFSTQHVVFSWFMFVWKRYFLPN